MVAKTSKKQTPKMKKTVKKSVTKTVKAVKKSAVKPALPESTHGLRVSVAGTDSATASHITLEKTVFDHPVNRQLIAQAVRVYLANQRVGGAHTKTRGEVEGSTRKIFRQKGTGRARHGNIRAPIFVGGGIVFGPVSHDFSLTMPDKMKQQALMSALSLQAKSGNIVVIDGLEKLEPKTARMVASLSAVVDLTSVLLVLPKDATLVYRAARNISGIDILFANQLNTYAVMTHKKIVFMKQAVPVITDLLLKKKERIV